MCLALASLPNAARSIEASCNCSTEEYHRDSTRVLYRGGHQNKSEGDWNEVLGYIIFLLCRGYVVGTMATGSKSSDLYMESPAFRPLNPLRLHPTHRPLSSSFFWDYIIGFPKTKPPKGTT